MARTVREEDVWKYYSIKQTGSAIEIREQRLQEIVIAALVVTMFPCILAILFYMNYGYFGLVQFCICLIALGVGAYTFLIAMKMPRAIRFFYRDNVIEQSSTLGFIRWRRRWIDSTSTELKVLEVEYKTSDAPTEAEPESESFTWKRHFDELLETLLPIRTTYEFFRGRKSESIATAFGLFGDPDQQSVLVVIRERNDLDDLIQAWLYSNDNV